MSEEIFHAPREQQPREPGEAELPDRESPKPTDMVEAQPDQPQGSWPIRQLAVGVGAVVVLALAGLLIWQVYFPSANKLLSNGEAHWRAGLLARQQRDWDKAIARFSKAAAASEEVLRYLEQQHARQTQSLAPQQEHLLGLAYWLRARSLFGIAAAQLEKEAAEKQSSPPPGLPDSADGEVLELFMIAEETPRSEALHSLYLASEHLRDRVAVLREALKHRMNESFDSWNWHHIQRLADDLIKTGTQDASLLARAYYALALVAYYQPDLTQQPAQPIAHDRRDPRLLLEALQWLEKLESVEKPLRFRAVYLRAQIWHWLAFPPSRKPVAKPEERKHYHDQLQKLLYDSEHGLPGALSQQAEQQLEKLSPRDIEGIFGLYRLAIDQLAKSAAATPDELQQRKQQLALSTLKLAKQAESLPEARALQAWRVVRETASLLLLLRSESANAWWPEAVQQVDQSADKLADRVPQLPTPADYADLAELALTCARTLATHQAKQVPQWKQRAKVWLDRARQALDKTVRDEKLRTRLDRIQRDIHR